MHWHRIWNPETPADWAASAALLPLSWLYGLGWRSYAAVYQLGLKRRRHFSIPILGIGNLEVGGSGKTPATVAVARLLSGRKIAISSSAYGSPSSAGANLFGVDVVLDPKRHGDEPCLLRRLLPNVPLILGRNRVLAAEIAESCRYDALVLDDGFQHLPLARTADVVLWNAGRRNHRLLPAGPMREPVSGLLRASALFVSGILDGCKLPSFAFRRVFPGFRNLVTGEHRGWEWAGGRTFNALCAIGSPQSFLQTLRDGGVQVEQAVVLADHDPLTSIEMDINKTWVVTSKDAVKLAGRKDLPNETYELEMEVQFCDEEGLSDWLSKTLFH